MKQATLNYEECRALADICNKYIIELPDTKVSDALRRAAGKIEEVISSGNQA